MIIDNNTILITQNGVTGHYVIYNDKDNFLLLKRVYSDDIIIFANVIKFQGMSKSELYEQAKEM